MIGPFDKINEKDREILLKKFECTTLKIEKNTSLFSMLTRQDLDKSFGIIMKGSLQIIKSDSEGNRSIVNEVSVHEIFGYDFSSLLSEDTNIFAKENSEIIFLEYSLIMNNLDNSSSYIQFLKNLLAIETDIINQRNNHIKVLTKKSIRNKLLEYFNSLEKKYNSKSFFLPFTITDLADYLAIDRSAMSREIKKLKEDKMIIQKRKKIVLLYDQSNN